MIDADARFARYVLLCEKFRRRAPPSMNDVEEVAVALILRRNGWLRHRGYTAESALAFIGPANAGVIERVRLTLDDP